MVDDYNEMVFFHLCSIKIQIAFMREKKKLKLNDKNFNVILGIPEKSEKEIW